MVLVGWLPQDPCVVSLRCAGEIYLTGPHLQKANFIYLSQSVKSSASVLFLFYIFSLCAQTLFLLAECTVTQQSVSHFFIYSILFIQLLSVQIGDVNKFIIDKMLLNNAEGSRPISIRADKNFYYIIMACNLHEMEINFFPFCNKFHVHDWIISLSARPLHGLEIARLNRCRCVFSPIECIINLDLILLLI